MRLVILESPYAGDIERNVAYARACMADCLRRGEAPIASHLLYTQPGVLDDDVPAERALGIEAGLAWGRVVEAVVFYLDLGMSKGMMDAWKRHTIEARPLEMRRLPSWKWPAAPATRCAMCDGTGYKDHAGFAMDACECKAPQGGHGADCAWHVDQYPWECTCGAIGDSDLLRAQLMGEPLPERPDAWIAPAATRISAKGRWPGSEVRLALQDMVRAGYSPADAERLLVQMASVTDDAHTATAFLIAKRKADQPKAHVQFKRRGA